ncbi:NAD(P)H-dependent oxidoreductase [Staphylococcus simulans]|uniref:NAD(P)H-dependent oxidoreductase n=1 Tax=Staphylococcus simulans TaxID=1286 RepID=UPI001E42AD56|nr:NAD(P)H-dependent oxidoreductase [Staphylococcus simulans]MCD8916486.1 NAD(P)H-dependent oxidoreductase [Staphylococcus simulans]
MNILIVYAHPEPQSFNGKLKDIAQTVLKENGNNVVVSDLYKMNFNPVAQKSDFKYLKNNNFFKYPIEQEHAYKNNILSKEIKSELSKLLWADIIIFQFPLWWSSVPAILKGWFDKVLIYGGIYGGAYGKFKKARLSNKKAIISTTTGSSGDIHRQVLFHISHGIVEYTGMQCLDTLIAYEIDKDQNSRDEYIEFFKNKIKYI